MRDFFECQNVVEACWFEGFFTQFCEVFECQKFRHVEFLMLELASSCLSTQSVISLSLKRLVVHVLVVGGRVRGNGDVLLAEVCLSLWFRFRSADGQVDCCGDCNHDDDRDGYYVRTSRFVEAHRRRGKSRMRISCRQLSPRALPRLDLAQNTENPTTE